MMMDRVGSFLFMLLLSIPFTIINFNSYLKGEEPIFWQVAASVSFLMIWFAYGLIRGLRKKEFVLLSSIFWGIGALLVLAGYLSDTAPVISYLAMVIFPGPVYGIIYFFDMASGKEFVYLSLLLTYALSLIGHLAGKVWRNRKDGRASAS